MIHMKHLGWNLKKGVSPVYEASTIVTNVGFSSGRFICTQPYPMRGEAFFTTRTSDHQVTRSFSPCAEAYSSLKKLILNFSQYAK